MSPTRESHLDRRSLLVTLARAAVASGAVAASAVLLVRRQTAPCGVVRECTLCAAVEDCPVRALAPAPAQKRS